MKRICKTHGGWVPEEYGLNGPCTECPKDAQDSYRSCKITKDKMECGCLYERMWKEEGRMMNLTARYILLPATWIAIPIGVVIILIESVRAVTKWIN